MSEVLSLLQPDWPAPANVKVVVTERHPGHSLPPWDSANLALHVGDEPQAVQANRQLLQQITGVAHIQWLEQVHGTEIVEAAADSLTRTADGCTTHQTDMACAVLTADCLPLLLCDRQGTQVAAVHAGWRGLTRGIVGRAIELFTCPASDLLAWLGPAIGPNHFEVGVEVLEAAFDMATNPESTERIGHCFTPGARPLKFYANLFELTRIALDQAGVSQIYGDDICTVTHNQRFFSYRKEGQTGRFASLIWLTTSH